MKRSIVFFVILLPFLKGNAQTNTTVEGILPDLKAGSVVYISRQEFTKKDSAIAGEGGRFKIELNVPTGSLYLLSLRNFPPARETMVLFYLQSGKVKIQGKGTLLDRAVYSGSQFVLDNNDLQQVVGAAVPEMEGLIEQRTEAIKGNDQSKLGIVNSKLRDVETARREVIKQWIMAHKHSPIAAFALYSISSSLPIDETERYYNILSDSAIINNAVAERIWNGIQAARKLVIGNIVSDFAQSDTAGRPISLRSFRGKYVLIDFWASWCGPCRAENPFLVETFNRFKDRNFQIISISLDSPNDKQKWINAILKDRLTWTQLSDLNGWENEVAKKYGVKYVPSNFLINPDGRLIATDLHGAQLQQKLESLFK